MDITRYRQSWGLLSRLDTIPYKYAYIEERFNSSDSTFSTSEYYFQTPLNQYNQFNFEDRNILPGQLWVDGKQIDYRYVYYSSAVSGIVFTGLYEYYYTLDTLLPRARSLRPFQELSYDPTPALTQYTDAKSWSQVDTASATKAALEKKYKEWLQSTSQIVTFVDRERNKVIVSVQFPVKNPVFASYAKEFEYYSW